MSTSDLCAESANSTDCLLRSLIKLIEDHNSSEDAEFNWDPITFAFTASIGVLATVLTLIAVFQAFLTASTGRRKADWRAIGSWSKRTRKIWSWRDLNRLSYATTPILRPTTLPMLIMAERQRQKEKLTGIREQLVSSFKLKLKSNVKDVTETAATWPRFLKSLGLLGIEDHLKEEYVRTTLVDYLPDDVLAAPAYAEVSLIAASMAAVGARTMKTDGQSSYPVIVGSNFQFDFRQHPTLGVVGAFSSFGNPIQRVFTKSVPLLDTLRDLYTTCDHAEGRLDFSAHCTIELKSEILFIWKKLDTVRFTRSPFILDDFKLFDYAWGSSRTGYKLFSPREFKHDFTWLLIAGSPTLVPSIFPVTKAVPGLDAITLLPLYNRFWSSHGLRIEEERAEIDSTELFAMLKRENLELELLVNDVPLSEAGLLDVSGVTDLLAGHECTPVYRASRFLSKLAKYRRDAKNSGQRKIFILSPVLQACVQLLYGCPDFRTSFDAMGIYGRQFLRALFLLQLQELDRWLPKNEPMSTVVQRQTMKLNGIVTILLEVEKAIAHNEFGVEGRSWHEFDRPDLPEMIVGQHFRMMQTLGRFILEFQNALNVAQSLDSTETATESAVRRYKAPLACILRSVSSEELSYPELACYTVAMLEQMMNQWLPRGSMEQQDSEHHDHEQDNIEEAVDTVIVWRALLMYLLFSTTPLDSSDMIDSGVWLHTIPIL